MRACNEDESNKHRGTDPWEVFSQLVILVVEGRTPGGDRGYHAGPHCLHPQQPIGSRHECNLNSTICLKADMLLKQLRLMWEVGVGLSIEVLLAPDCRHGVDIANTLDTTSAPLPTLRLLEQWNFTISDRRMPGVTSSGWALVAAVRSYLHFSQLSAWLSSSGGSSPPNVLYRLTVTSPVFCSKFEGIPEVHNFPFAMIGSETSMKVVVRTLPRTDKIPNIICVETHASSSRDSAFAESSKATLFERSNIDVSAGAMIDVSVKDQTYRTDEDLRRSMMKAKLTDAVLVRRSESPDTQLGESLLDPPNSMSRIPRRFQSPSRSGSPSLETPEHLLCKVIPPGPSHARPPGSLSFCQPLVIPARQPLNPFPWTRTCYPSVQPNATLHAPKPYHATQDKMFQGSTSSSTYEPNLQYPIQSSKMNAAVFVRPKPQYAWRQSIIPDNVDVSSDQGRPSVYFGPKLHNRDGPIAGPSNNDQWRSFKSFNDRGSVKSTGLLGVKKMDCDNVPSAFAFTASQPIKTVESSQGTKRKGIHKKESAKKRESPPHSSRLEEYGNSSSYMLNDQLWPRCSLPGKHLCTSTEDISDIYDKAAAADDIMPKTSHMKASRPGIPKLFDLTPKETKEILDVLRQSTPVPPLRINRVEIEHHQNVTELILNSKYKLSKYPENVDQTMKWKKMNNLDKINEIKPKIEPWEKLHIEKGRIVNEPSTSANYSCDNSIKKPLDSVQLPFCSTGVKRKLLNVVPDSVDNMKNCTIVTKCIHAKTVKEKTNSYTAISHPARSPRHMSVILGKKSNYVNQIGMKRSSPNSSDHEEDNESSKAKRSFVFKDVERDKQINAESRNNHNLTEKEPTYVKNETLLKRLMKPTNLSLTRFIDNLNSHEKYKSEIEPTSKLPKEIDEEGVDKENTNDVEDFEVEDLCRSRGVPIPSASDKVSFRRSFDSATNLVFHNKTGLPLTSSPAPMRKGNSFDYDSSLISVAAIKCALRSCDDEVNDNLITISSPTETVFKPVISLSAPATVTCSNLLGNFEESVLNGRLEPFSTVHGFKAEIAASGSFCPKHVAKPVTVFFYTLCDNYQMSSPYMGHVDLGKKGYQVPSKGTVQVTLFNPHATVVKMFVVMYDLFDMPPNSKTFIRQRTLNMPVGETDSHPNAHQWLRYLIHLRFASSRSGKIYLHTDIRMMIFRKADVDAALLHQTDVPYEVRSFTHGPTNPRFSPRK